MASPITFTITGVVAMVSALARIEKQMQDDLVIAVREEAEEIMRRAKSEFVPIDESTLKNSGFVEDVQREKDDVFVTMGFGSNAAAHALSVHETPSKFDPPSWKGGRVNFKQGGPKYLERPLMEAVLGMDARIARKVAPK